MNLNETELLRGVRLQKVEQCPICGTTERLPYDLQDDPGRLIRGVQCANCALVYMDAFVDSADLARFYSGYHQDRTGDNAALAAKRQQMYVLDAEYAMRFVGGGHQSLLDVGCGAGDFLAHFPDELGRYGIEIDSLALRLGQKLYPSVTFFSSPEQAAQTVPGAFDVVIFRGTLQYMPDLSVISAFVRSHIRPGGRILLLATPNADSLLARVQREDWGLYNSIEHRYCFGIKQLQRLFGNEFHLLDYALPYLGTPYENYLNDLDKVCTLLKNGEGASRKQSIPFFGSMMNVVFERI